MTESISLPALKRRFRTARFKIERMERDLRELLEALPAPTGEEYQAMLGRKAPLTLEAWLVGALELARFHLMEAEDIAQQALAETKRSLQQGSYRLDLMYSLGNVIDRRARKRK
jgi:hypothetical protein